MKIRSKMAKWIVPILLIILVTFQIPLVGTNHDSLSKIHPAVLQQIRESPDRVLHVIVSKVPGSHPESKAIRLGAEITSKWDFINIFAVEIKASQIPALAAAGGIRMINTVSSITDTEDPLYIEGFQMSTDSVTNSYNATVKADMVWNAGYYGEGVTAAVVDSGINNESPSDFGSRILANEKFNATTIYMSDRYGHGTHVAGIIAGDGRNSQGKYVGIAPKANLINVKYSNDEGCANEEDLINALQWVYDNRATYNIRIVNISSTVDAIQSYTESAACAAVEQLWKAGVVVVVSAGNLGSSLDAVSHAPANDPFVITVGAIDDMSTKTLQDDFVKLWSSCGTTLDGVNKPDILAPGARIVSYMPSGILRSQAPANIVDTSYFKMGGTSMAAPMVSGVVALMLQVNPELTPDQVKWVISNSMRAYDKQAPGTPGIIDAQAAVFLDRFGGIIGTANQGLTLSPLLDPNTAVICYDNMGWSNMGWSNMGWSNDFKY